MTVVTGAGISAESGIPTFRGAEGYWTVGSRNYQPQEIGTWAMFRQQPREVWRWYLYRRGVCRAAQPNEGHLALSQIAAKLGDRFTLVTQNVDGLHLRAGHAVDNCFEIHGNLDFMRSTNLHDKRLLALDDDIVLRSRDEAISADMWQRLHWPDDGRLARPHVLWWDETYDEVLYRFNSSLRVAYETDLLFTVGTSGATNLPNHIFFITLEQGGTVIDINVRDNWFAQYARQYGGYALQGASSNVLQAIAVTVEDA